MKSGSASCRADTLIARTKSASTRPRATQSPTSATAVRSTHSPIPPISPISSASPMNSVGPTGISVPGRCHRTSASTPWTSPLKRSTIGWYCRASCRSATARRNATSVSMRVRASRSSWASKISTRSRPRSLARYIAASASASSWAAVRSVSPPAGRHADREGDGHRALAHVDRAAQSGSDALHGRERGPRVGEVLAQHHELVAAEATDRVGAPHAAREAPGDLAQHLVTDLVAERVVDQLEVIDVHEHHRDRSAAPAGGDDRLLGARGEQRPIRQAGQRIVQALMGELGGGVDGARSRAASRRAPRAASRPSASSAQTAATNAPNSSHAACAVAPLTDA